MPHIDNIPAGKREQLAERRVKALDLRKAGLSYRQIGQRLDVSANSAHNDVRVALADLAAKELSSAEQLRQLELERLDMALTQVAQVLAKARSDEVKLRAVDRLVRISESRRKLLGVDLEQGTVNVDQRSVTFVIETDHPPPPVAPVVTSAGTEDSSTHAKGNGQSPGAAEAGDVPALDGA